MSNASSWPIVKLGSILTDIQPGFASGKHNSQGTGLPHLRPMNVSTNGQIDRSVVKSIDPRLADRPARRLQSGDVLFNNTNSPELVGKTALFIDPDEPAFSNHMTRLRTNPSRVDPRFLALRLHQAWREGWFAAHCNNHVSQASIGRDVLRAFEIELPPLDIQQSISVLADAVDTRRASSAAHLAAGRRATERLRQAILASACSGRLTADWREQHPEALSVEHALAEVAGRRQRKTRSAEQAVDLSLPDVPGTYVLATLGAAAEILDYGTSKRCEATLNGGVPVLRMGNIQDGRLDLANLKYCGLDKEIQRLLISDGDLLFNRTNSPELVGKSAVFHGHDPMSFASYLIRVRFHSSVAHPDFVSYWINSAWGREWARLAKTDGVSQSNINGTKLSLMPLPLPPLEEQQMIVERASQMLTQTDELLSRIEAARLRIERSSQAVLAKAFRGELVTNGKGPGI